MKKIRNNLFNNRGLLSLLLLAYVVVIVFFVFALLHIPTIYEKLENERIATIQSEIARILDETDNVAEIEKQLFYVLDEHSIELVLATEDKLVYSTLPYTQEVDGADILHRDAFVLRQYGTHTSAYGDYSVFLGIYHADFSEYFDVQFMWLTIFVVIIFVIFLFIVIVMDKLLFSPLEAIRRAIRRMREYKFENIDLPKDNMILKEFEEFSVNLQERMETVSEKYTQLELLLLFEQEKLNHLLKISRATIHELKTPLHQTLIKNELLMEEYENNKSVEVVTKYNVQRMDTMLNRVNDVLILLKQNVYQIENQIENFDLIRLFDDLLEEFLFFFSQHNLILEVIVPEHLNVIMNKFIVELVIHNLLSNVVEHALPETEVVFEIEEVDEKSLKISCENDITLKDMERLRAINNNSFANLSASDYSYSSGNGIYLIKELVSFIKGTISININEQDEKVSIEIMLPVKELE